ncbi:hypothetical protein F66182_3413 [Fusarium sp. NRRL 66182]|nr:hypothetical protein F66182_3413 [Fusarium sp. NRRL 66182]
MQTTFRGGMWIAVILHLASTATACAGGSYVHRRATHGSASLAKRADEGFTGCLIPEPVTCEALGTCAYANNSAGPWTPEANIRQMQLADDAANANDLSHFNHHDDTIVFMPGNRELNMAQHVQDLLGLWATYPNLRASNHPYRVSFGEGNWTFALSDASGTNTGPIQSPSGWRGPTGRNVNYEFLTAAYWQDGRIMREHIWMDTVTTQRQLGFFLSPISTDRVHTFELSPHSLPLSTDPERDATEENKRSHRQLETAFNQGRFDPQSLNFSSNATIYASRDDAPDGIGSTQLVSLIDEFTESFSDANHTSTVIIGSGDWTASVGRLSGRHTGTLNIPEYISPPIPPTNRTFEVWMYTIAHWQDGELTHLKLMIDELAILSQLE